MAGSTDKTEEMMVQISRQRMIKSNLVRTNPSLRLATVRKIHPHPARLIAIALAATECGANAA